MMRILWSILLVLIFVPQWSGEPQLPLLGSDRRIESVPVNLDPAHPARRRVGDLLWLGGIELRGRGDAFGGFSSLHIDHGRFTLLSDGGNIVSFKLGHHNVVEQVRFAELPDGPGSGWAKYDRDSESMAVDPRTGQIWIGFERANEIWRYAPDFARAEVHAAPPAMDDWPVNTGAESMTLLPGGGMLVIAERAGEKGHRHHPGIFFAADPTRHPRLGFRFEFVPPPGYDPSDMTVLPDGRLLILTRRFALPFVFSNKLVVVDRHAIRPGAIVRGREIATLAAPLIHDNFEGVVATRENGATIIWLVSDDNQLFLQRSLLLKFRLAPEAVPPANRIRRR
ncbi:hypothetical protein BH10PSE14_BH10PSE14_38390 [soil metagenome]